MLYRSGPWPRGSLSLLMLVVWHWSQLLLAMDLTSRMQSTICLCAQCWVRLNPSNEIDPQDIDRNGVWVLCKLYLEMTQTSVQHLGWSLACGSSVWWPKHYSYIPEDAVGDSNLCSSHIAWSSKWVGCNGKWRGRTEATRRVVYWKSFFAPRSPADWSFSPCVVLHMLF